MKIRQRNRSLIKGFYPILDCSYTTQWSPFRLAEEILSSGVKILQLRQKNLRPKEFLDLAQQIYYLKVHNDFTFIINHHVEVAGQIGADGVHLTSKSMSVAEARKVMGDDAIIGISVHSLEEGIKKEGEGADYLTFGAIYPTKTKGPDHPVQGIDSLIKLVEAVSIPVVAIGGIDLNRVDAIKRAKGQSFTSLSPIMSSPNPKSLCQQFQDKWLEEGAN